MKIQRRTFISRAAASTAVAALSIAGLAACGDSGSEAPAAGEGELTPVRVNVAPIHFETAYIAEKQGYFEEQGLDVELGMGSDPASLLAQVVAGEVDISIGSWINVATSVAQGVPVQVIGGNGVVDPSIDNSGVLVPADSGIADLKDLEGKTIGVQGVKSGGDIPVLQALQGAGADVASVKEVAIPYSGMQAALEQGTVDAVMAADSFYHDMVATEEYEVISNPVREYQSEMPVTVWTVSNQWIPENGETAEAFIAAMEDAVEFYSDEANLEEVRAVHAEVNQMDAAEAPDHFVPASVTINSEPSELGLTAMVDFELIDEPITLDEVLWENAPRQ